MCTKIVSNFRKKMAIIVKVKLIKIHPEMQNRVMIFWYIVKDGGLGKYIGQICTLL